MKNLGLLLIFSISIILSSCKSGEEYKKNTDGSITWITIDQAATLKNDDKKLYFVDLYTDWCGWCKVMDKKTFTDNEVIEYLDQNFHNVKFNAEQTAAVNWEGKEYIYKQGGRKGIHELAPLLLNNRLSYPSFAVLDENRNPIKVIVGYKKPDQLMTELRQLKG